MLDKLIEFLTGFIGEMKPYIIIEHYNRGVRLRLGKLSKVLEPGIHFKIPCIDTCIEITVKPTTMNLSMQTITTKDWKSVAVESVVKYEIKDVTAVLLEVFGPKHALADLTKGIIRNSITERDWKDCNGPELTKEIKEKAKREADKWGLRVLDVTLTSLAEVPSVRVINSNYTETSE